MPTTILSYLRKLEKNNNKAWFDAHRAEYELARDEFIEIVRELLENMVKFEPSLKDLEPKSCLFRINRDVRFGTDKTPYKNHFSAYFNKGGKKASGGGYYIHIEPGKSFSGSGVWAPPAPELSLIRQEIDYNFEEWRKFVSAAGFKKTFPNGLSKENILQRPPKGYDDLNPALDYLKLKSYVAIHSFPDDEVQEPAFAKKAAAIFKAAKPLNDFINRALD